MIRVATEADIPRVSELIGADASDCMARVVTLLSEHGGFFLERLTPSVLEAHMFFAPEGRGKHAIGAAREGLRYAFNEMNALVVFGRIPIEDRPARMLTRLIGFMSDGLRPRIPGEPAMVEWFEMRSDQCPQQ